MKQELKVVMLPTNDRTQIAIHDRLGLITAKSQGWDDITRYDYIVPQHLYFTSNEVINAGDWVLFVRTWGHTLDTHIPLLRKVDKVDNRNYTFDTGNTASIGDCDKIVASTDPSLGLPLISTEDIEAYVSAPYDTVDVEMYIDNKKPFLNLQDGYVVISNPINDSDYKKIETMDNISLFATEKDVDEAAEIYGYCTINDTLTIPEDGYYEFKEGWMACLRNQEDPKLVFDKEINSALNHIDALDSFMSYHEEIDDYGDMSELIEKLKVSLQTIKTNHHK